MKAGDGSQTSMKSKTSRKRGESESRTSKTSKSSLKKRPRGSRGSRRTQNVAPRPPPPMPGKTKKKAEAPKPPVVKQGYTISLCSFIAWILQILMVVACGFWVAIAFDSMSSALQYAFLGVAGLQLPILIFMFTGFCTPRKSFLGNTDLYIFTIFSLQRCCCNLLLFSCAD